MLIITDTVVRVAAYKMCQSAHVKIAQVPFLTQKLFFVLAPKVDFEGPLVGLLDS